ncbi:rod shape-determining protein MreC [Candidatus Kinetoplastibacterium desouzaii TCC079E]|uniref:Cell shape-determining protein MreC n=1 Tax=Candidatus Kinetoplastidibacterium desouzai TCC079E TaxID=1208919 RepID=M1LVD3_9PROT|nr:rod shape-determining protein MreC [Candidatus Kinetoplastibacterium desouzaii]AGF47214.1 rod shape-determining protein MreC [Candidatus Kinetoplastibacterium desouzaii TCC079E]
MRSQDLPPLFRQGITLEIKLFILVMASFVLLILDTNFHSKMEPIRRTILVSIYPFQRIVLIPRDLVGHFKEWFNTANMIRMENEELQRRRIELSQVTAQVLQLTAENHQLRGLLGITGNIKQSSIVVEVLYETNNVFNQHLVFNKGSKEGILPGMPVISEGGVVGQIIRVTPFTSEAALVSDCNILIPVQITRNGLRLITFGRGISGFLEVRYLYDDFDIKKDDILVTSGIGGVFPAGLPVAQVISVEKDYSSGYSQAIAKSVSHPECYRHFIVLKVEVE